MSTRMLPARQTLTGRIDLPPRIDSAPAIGLEWLVRLRWGLAFATLVVIAAAKLLGLPVDDTVAAGACVATVLTNVGLLAWSRRGRAASSVLLALVLVVDGILLTIALRASGGSMNPFSVLYIVHVALAALLLDGGTTWLVTFATCLGFGTLFWGGTPHAAHHHDQASMDAHLHGMLAAYALAAAFVGYFVYRVARALERREREMLALREWAARTEKLASLSALAAGAAHELGTPLGTIAVIAKELERAAQPAAKELDRDALAADARLVREEAERCRHILAKMSSNAGEGPAGPPRRTTIAQVLGRVRAALGEPRTSALAVEEPPQGAFVVAPDDALVQALVNLVANAFEACTGGDHASVVLHTSVGDDRVRFRVEDHGAGMAEDVLRRLGEPFFSTKEGRGMGLGVFLARSFAERAGGTLEVESQSGLGSAFTLELPGGVA